MKDSILGMLGLMRKASALAIGKENTVEALNSGKARLMLIPNDASEKKRTDAGLLLRGKNTMLVEFPYSSAEIAEAIGVGGCSVLCVTDLGFSDSLLKRLSEQNPEYAGAYDEMHRRSEKAKRRRQETAKSGKKNQREGE